MPFDPSLRNTCIFLAFFVVAFFPNAFNLLLRPLYLPFELLSRDPYPAKKSIPICDCCPPASCPLPLPQSSPLPPIPTPTMSWVQKTFTLPPKSRGSYLITDAVLRELPELKRYRVGVLHLFVQHTSCGLSLNENWDEDVRADMSDALDRLAPEDRKGDLYRHSAEGLDDMPAHIKSALVGASVSVPISDGRLNTGTWQGIWYLEFRAGKQARKVVATIQGETREG